MVATYWCGTSLVNRLVPVVLLSSKIAMKTFEPAKMNDVKQFFFYALAACAGTYALIMITFNWSQLIQVFQLGDPTGLFGFLLQVGSFVSNVCVIIIASLARMSIEERPLIPYRVSLLIFGIKLLEALSLLPCAIGFGDAFCGLWWVILSVFTSPTLIAITLIFLLSSGKRFLVRTGMGIVGSVTFAGILLFFVLTPKSPDACLNLTGVTDRAACLKKFALRDNNVRICRKIEFRSRRFECLYKVAEETEVPAICEEIDDPPGTEITPYETPSSSTRDLCYYLLGFKMHSQDMCQKVNDSKMREVCRSGVGVPGQKRKLF